MAAPDYFTLFNLPRHLHLDTAALEKAFYAQSRKLHPDRFAAKPQAEQEAALAASSQLNDAYRTLREPIARTEYLLSLEGIQMEEQSRAATDACQGHRHTKEASRPARPPRRGLRTQHGPRRDARSQRTSFIFRCRARCDG